MHFHTFAFVFHEFRSWSSKSLRTKSLTASWNVHWRCMKRSMPRRPNTNRSLWCWYVVVRVSYMLSTSWRRDVRPWRVRPRRRVKPRPPAKNTKSRPISSANSCARGCPGPRHRIANCAPRSIGCAASERPPPRMRVQRLHIRMFTFPNGLCRQLRRSRVPPTCGGRWFPVRKSFPPRRTRQRRQIGQLRPPRSLRHLTKQRLSTVHCLLRPILRRSKCRAALVTWCHRRRPLLERRPRRRVNRYRRPEEGAHHRFRRTSRKLSSHLRVVHRDRRHRVSTRHHRNWSVPHRRRTVCPCRWRTARQILPS